MRNNPLVLFKTVSAMKNEKGWEITTFRETKITSQRMERKEIWQFVNLSEGLNSVKVL